MLSSASSSIHILGDEQVLTVSELSCAIKGHVEKNFSALKLRGEVSELKNHSSGHTYLKLKDEDAVIKAVVWKGTRIGFPLENGVEVIVDGRVTTYYKGGDSVYQFVIKEARIAGEGAILKMLNERRKLFAARGYFDNKRPLPKFPQIIGIVTSKTGAVLQDMRNRLEDRYPFCNVLVWSVNVQGKEAGQQIASAVRGFNFMTERRPDILIVARGGGSAEDLLPFSEEVVVRAVFESKIPVVSGVGHETDTTLVDYAADLRASTPTAAIELSTPVLADEKEKLLKNVESIRKKVLAVLESREEKCASLLKNFANIRRAFVAEKQQTLDSTDKIYLLARNFWHSKSHKFTAVCQRFTSVQMKIGEKFQKMTEMLSAAMRNFLEKKKLKKELPDLQASLLLRKQHLLMNVDKFLLLKKRYFADTQNRISVLFNRLEQSSFKKVLARGFCFVTDKSGRIVGTAENFRLAAADGLTLHFQDGEVQV
ncbi:MAG: exodeoxyribonuclease VII large subunit [Alphaproteobacteria bacterium]|nr:exodeoxyribonuclease VII large subunit [Alphaproteobacteria bacterium]